MTAATCSRCGAGATVASGRRVCEASSGGRTANLTWQVAVCRDCAHADLTEDRRRMVRVAPWKGLLLTLFAVLLGAVVVIALSEPGLAKLWAIPFGLLFLRALSGPVTLLTLPAALARSRLALERLGRDELDAQDRDLLVHLESHRLLTTLKIGFAEPQAGVRLPELEAAEGEKIRYQLRRQDEAAPGSDPDGDVASAG